MGKTALVCLKMLECNEQFCVRQLCKAYMHFMTELAKLIRTERGLAINETQINQEVIRILEFESDLANVRHFSFGFLLFHLYTTIILPEIPTDLLSVLNHFIFRKHEIYNVATVFATSPFLYFSFLDYRYSGGP